MSSRSRQAGRRRVLGLAYHLSTHGLHHRTTPAAFHLSSITRLHPLQQGLKAPCCQSWVDGHVYTSCFNARTLLYKTALLCHQDGCSIRTAVSLPVKLPMSSSWNAGPWDGMRSTSTWPPARSTSCFPPEQNDAALHSVTSLQAVNVKYIDC